MSFIAKNRRETGMFVLLLLLIVWTTLGTREAGVEGVFGSRFLTFGNFLNVSRQIGIYGIFSIGVGIVIITAGIDLSIGSLMSFFGVCLCFILTGEIGWLPALPWPLAVAALMVLGLVIGIAHGVLIGKYKLQAFVVTLCGLLSYRGIARFMADDSAVGYSDANRDGQLTFLVKLTDGTVADVLGLESGKGILASIPMTLVYLTVIAIVMFIVLHRSVYGRYLFAAGRNELATKYSGINTNLVIGGAYVICGTLAAFSSILFTFYTGSIQPSVHGVFFELYAIAAAVLGGCSLRGGEGSILGILIGTTILIVLQNMVNLLGYESSLSDAITGGVIFVGVLADQVGVDGVKGLWHKLRPKAT